MHAKLTSTTQEQTPIWLDRFMKTLIIGSGVVVFVLLAWVHLGVGAWLFPPAPSPMRQVATAGPYQVTLQADSGQLKARIANTVTVSVQDAAGHKLANATVVIDPVMTTMPMTSPTVTGTTDASGAAIMHPVFTMAGIWKVTVTLHTAGQPDQRASFAVSVRW